MGKTDDKTVMDRPLTEVYDPGFAFREATVDRESRTIRDVSLLGRTSRNGRVYSPQALREAADLHKGVGIFLDHPTRTEERERGGVRSVRDLAGRVLTASVNSDRVKGDIQALEGPEGDRILALAEQMPGVAGFSHRAQGEIRPGDEGDVVESISAVHGADVVTDPATVGGLFESLDTDQETEMDIEELTVETLREERPELVEEIREEAEEKADAESLREENRKLKEQVDNLEAEKREREHTALVEEKLSEADLPDRAVTDTFREMLSEADNEEAMDALIEDRKELVASTRSSGPKSTRREPDVGSDEYEPVTPEAIEEADRVLWT